MTGDKAKSTKTQLHSAGPKLGSEDDEKRLHSAGPKLGSEDDEDSVYSFHASLSWWFEVLSKFCPPLPPSTSDTMTHRENDSFRPIKASSLFVYRSLVSLIGILAL